MRKRRTNTFYLYFSRLLNNLYESSFFSLTIVFLNLLTTIPVVNAKTDAYQVLLVALFDDMIGPYDNKEQLSNMLLQIDTQ